MKRLSHRLFPLACLLGLLTALQPALASSKYDESLFKGMNWRLIGPFRGGRVLAVTGVPGEPYTFILEALPAASGEARTAAPSGRRCSIRNRFHPSAPSPWRIPITT